MFRGLYRGFRGIKLQHVTFGHMNNTFNSAIFRGNPIVKQPMMQNKTISFIRSPYISEGNHMVKYNQRRCYSRSIDDHYNGGTLFLASMGVVVVIVSGFVNYMTMNNLIIKTDYTTRVLTKLNKDPDEIDVFIKEEPLYTHESLITAALVTGAFTIGTSLLTFELPIIGISLMTFGYFGSTYFAEIVDELRKSYIEIVKSKVLINAKDNKIKEKCHEIAKSNVLINAQDNKIKELERTVDHILYKMGLKEA